MAIPFLKRKDIECETADQISDTEELKGQEASRRSLGTLESEVVSESTETSVVHENRRGQNVEEVPKELRYFDSFEGNEDLKKPNLPETEVFPAFKLRPNFPLKPDAVTSKVVAKERLKNAIMHEHIDLPDQMIALMRTDLIKSFKRYLNVNENEFEISWVRKKETKLRRDYLEVTARIPVCEK